MGPGEIKMAGGTIRIEFTEAHSVPLSEELVNPEKLQAIQAMAEIDSADVAALVPHLVEESTTLRLAAFNALATLVNAGVDATAALPQIIEALRWSEPKPELIAQFITRIGIDKAVPLLVEAMEIVDPLRLVLMLQELSASVIPVLIPLTAAPSPKKRYVAVYTLGSIIKQRPDLATSEAIRALIRETADEEIHIAGLAVMALGYAPVETDATVEKLIAVVIENEDLAGDALKALGNLGDKAKASLNMLRSLVQKSPDLEERELGLNALCMIDRENQNEYIREFVTRESRVTKKVASILTVIEERALPMIEEFLNHPRPLVRMSMCEALSEWIFAEIGVHTFLSLAAKLNNDETRFRLSIGKTMRDIARRLASERTEARGEELKHYEDVFVQVNGIYAAAVPSVIALLRDAEKKCQVLGMEILEAMGEAAGGAVAELIELTHSRRKEMRLAAMEALANIRPDHDEAVAVFEQGLETGDKAFVAAAIRGLGGVKHSTGRAAEVLASALDHEDSIVRRKVAEALGRLAVVEEAARTALKEALTHEDKTVQKVVRAALKNIGGE